MGSPHTVYNGGLCRATARYFDARAKRPGLPPGCAALVDSLARDMNELVRHNALACTTIYCCACFPVKARIMYHL